MPELALRLGVGLVVLWFSFGYARRLPVGWPRGAHRRPPRRAAQGHGVPEEVEARLKLAQWAMTNPVQFNGALVDWLIAIARERPSGRPRLFTPNQDPARREALASELMGPAATELARGLPPTPARVRAVADAIRRRWDG